MRTLLNMAIGIWSFNSVGDKGWTKQYTHVAREISAKFKRKRT